MLFTVLVGILGAAVFGLRKLFIKLRFLFSGGKQDALQKNRIPIAIFSDDKRYWNTFGPICRELDRRKQSAVYMTSSPDDPALKEEFQYVKCQFIGEGNKGYAKLNMLSADVLLATTPGLDVYQWRRSKDVSYYVHILHAVSDATLYRVYGMDYYDAVLLSGPYQADQIRKLEAVRDIEKKDLQVVGQPYMDELWKRLQDAPRADRSETTVLLAPSWGPNSILNRYGEKAIDALLATGYRIVVRPHPQSYTSEKEMLDRLMSKYPDLEWNRDNDNFDILNQADIMISDFSGVIFDFALVFAKPVIYTDTVFDKAPYDAYWIDDELWTFSTLDKIGVKLTEDGLNDMKSVIDHCLQDESFRKGIQQAREEAWNHVGHAAELAADYLIEKQQSLTSTASGKENTHVIS